jgi:hypothetical protein
MRDPETPAEWQEAVDCAYARLLLDSARQHQLVEGGPGVDVERCDAILARGREQQILPRCTGVDDHLAFMLVAMTPTEAK